MEEHSTQDVRLAGLRQVLVEWLVSGMYELREVGGPRCIPYMQLALALALATELEQCEGRDKAALDSLLARLVQELGVTAGLQGQELHSRSQAREFQLVILRLLSVLMSRSSRPASLSRHGGEPSSWVSRTTASALAQSGTVVHGLAIVKTILSYWQSLPMEEACQAGVPGSKLLRPSPAHPPPDMAPFFLKQYVRSHASNVFEAYPQLSTEMALRIPYLMKKISEAGQEPCTHFDQAWFYQLCELMMTPQAPFVKRFFYLDP